MKAWWQQLNPREQKLISYLAPLLGIFFLYHLIWQPLNENIAKGEQKLARQQQLLTWVQENTNRYQQVKGSGTANARRREFIEYCK